MGIERGFGTSRMGSRFGLIGVSFQVYYIPLFPIYNQSTFPTVYLQFPLLRKILIREQINIVHCHQVGLVAVMIFVGFLLHGA